MEVKHYQDLARQFMSATLNVAPCDHVWIEHVGPRAGILAQACAAEVCAVGGAPLLVDRGAEAVNRDIGALTKDEIFALGDESLARMKTMQRYIRIKDDVDESRVALSDDKRQWFTQALSPMTQYRVRNTRWLVVAAPTTDFAKALAMPQEAFEAFYRNVCLLDYGLMKEEARPLEALMRDAEDVRILAPRQNTDLSFSIKGIGSKACTGQNNIPDGECFSAPVRESVEGCVQFGASAYKGQRFERTRLFFKEGRVVRATAWDAEGNTVGPTKQFDAIVATDEGASYVGEFALNFNPYIDKPTGIILFDEKIRGGFHLAIGNCYDEADNGNVSSVHFDMIQIQRPEFGGGRIFFDGRLVREDGLFVVPELEGLNPEKLKAVKPSVRAEGLSL